MKYAIDKNDNYAVMSIENSNVNSIIASDLKSEFVLLKTEGVPNLILNLESVEYIDSSGLSALLTANRLWADSGASFVITEVKSPTVSKLIEISKLDQVFTIIPTLDESIDFVKMEVIERSLEEEE